MTRMASSIVGVARPQAALVASRAPRRTNTNSSVCCFKANLSRICAHSRFQHASYLLCAQILSIRKYKTTTNTCGIWVCICVAAVRRGWWVFDESKGQRMGRIQLNCWQCAQNNVDAVPWWGERATEFIVQPIVNCSITFQMCDRILCGISTQFCCQCYCFCPCYFIYFPSIVAFETQHLL